MIFLHRLRSLARWVFRRSEVEAELDRELDSFVEMSATDRLREGDAPDEARRRARMELRGVEQTKERVRTDRWGVQLDRLRQDLLYGWRSLARQPGFTTTVVLTLAIGIGFNTAIYTVVDATILRPLPFKQPEQLMKVSLTRPAENTNAQVDLPIWSYPKYETFRQNQQVFQDTALYRAIALNLTGEEEPERLRGEEVSAGYFPSLGIAAETGRTFLAEEDSTPERDLVAVISHGLWERRFGSDKTIIGKTITLDLKNYTVAGVLPAGFQGLSGPADIWVPVNRSSAEILGQRWAHAWELLARLRPGISVEQARSATVVLGKVVDEAHKSTGTWGAKAEVLNDVRVDATLRRSVLVLFGAVTCVLLIACVKVGNLLLARATARRREMAIRAAIGAGRARVMRQLLTESMLLAALGGAASLLVAYVSVYALTAISPAGSALAFGAGPSLLPGPRRLSGLTLLGLSSIRVDSSALLFTLAIALLAGMFFGLAPSWHAARAELTGALKKTDDYATGFQFRGKGILVVVEIALAFVLLTGAGLVIKSFARLTATPVGVNADNVLTVRVAVPSETANPEATVSFFSQLEERVAAQAGVVSAALGSCHALAGGCASTIIWFRDRPEVPKGTEPPIGVLRVSPNYFTTMKIPLLRGRLFTTADRGNAPKTVVISETAAQRYFPGEDPIGKRIGLGLNGFTQGTEIIGIAGNVRYGQMDQAPEPDAYVSLLQAPQQNMYLFARTNGDPAALIPAVRQQVSALNHDLPIYDVRSMQDRISDAAGRARFTAVLLAIFAGMAMVLAALGIYGVMSYMVRQRTREIGIRVALGARSRDVVWYVVRRTAGLVFAGTCLGLAGALAVTQVLTTSLYKVEPDDPQTYILISLILAAVALLAGYLPARRAGGVDPAITLRAE
jgi:putative ABC transport system permease protein